MNLAELLAALIDKTASNKVVWSQSRCHSQDKPEYVTTIKVDHGDDEITIELTRRSGSGRTGIYVKTTSQDFSRPAVFKNIGDTDPGSEMIIELFYLAEFQVTNNLQDIVDTALDHAIKTIKEL